MPISRAPSPEPRAHNIPYQNLTQDTRHLLINILLRARQLDIHIAVDANKSTLVFGLAPFETDDDFFVDPIHPSISAHIHNHLSTVAHRGGGWYEGGRTDFAASAAG